MHGTTESGSVSVNNLTSLQTLLTILMCAAANIQEDEAIKKVKEIIEKKNLEDMNKLLQLYALPRHDLLWESNWRFLQALSYVVAPLLWIFPTMPGLTFKAPITDKAILEDIVKQLQKKLSEKTTAQNPLFEFLDNAYGKFQAFCSNKEQPDATRGSGDIRFTEDPNGNIHIAVLGTNGYFTEVYLKHLEEKLAKQRIDKSKVYIHLLCKSGQNAVIQEAYWSELPEGTELGEAKEMYKVFEGKGFAEVKKHIVEGKYIGTEPTLEKFYQDYNGKLPKNLIFLCCPNTLKRQVDDIKLFLEKKRVPQDIQDSIQFITFSQQETAKYLESLLKEIEDEKEKANGKEKEEYEREEYIIKFFLKPEIILSSFFAEMAKELYAVLQMQKLNESKRQSGIPKGKPVEPSLPPPQSRELLDKKLEGQSEKTKQEQEQEQEREQEQKQKRKRMITKTRIR